MLKLTTDKHEAARGLSATAELLVLYSLGGIGNTKYTTNYTNIMF